MARLAVIGSPVAHSLSPVMHNAVFARLGMDATYGALDVRPEDFASTVEALRHSDYVGLSVTMPHKDAALRISDDVSDEARRVGAVNTLSFVDGRIVGHSTDGTGCVRALEHHGVVVDGSRCVVLGAGGAARSVIVALATRGARDVVVVNRTRDKAVAAIDGLDRCRVGTVDDLAGAQVVVNCTSVGMGTSESPVPRESLREVGCVLDAVYFPLRTSLLDDAVAFGAIGVDGLWMLVYQAVEQQRIWFDHAVDPVVMRDAALAELARRGNDPTL